MTDSEKIKCLRLILKYQLQTYSEWVRRQKLPEDHEDFLDDSFTYDCSIELFSDLRRGDAQHILEVLSENYEF